MRRETRVGGDRGEGDRAALLRIADRCPMHRTLAGDAVLETELGGSAPASV